jgi:hypothetical protein
MTLTPWMETYLLLLYLLSTFTATVSIHHINTFFSISSSVDVLTAPFLTSTCYLSCISNITDPLTYGV